MLSTLFIWEEHTPWFVLTLAHAKYCCFNRIQWVYKLWNGVELHSLSNNLAEMCAQDLYTEFHTRSRIHQSQSLLASLINLIETYFQIEPPFYHKFRAMIACWNVEKKIQNKRMQFCIRMAAKYVAKYINHLMPKYFLGFKPQWTTRPTMMGLASHKVLLHNDILSQFYPKRP